jgi:hypothetical protein
MRRARRTDDDLTPVAIARQVSQIQDLNVVYQAAHPTPRAGPSGERRHTVRVAVRLGGVNDNLTEHERHQPGAFTDTDTLRSITKRHGNPPQGGTPS